MGPTIIRVICATPTLVSSQVHQENNRKSFFDLDRSGESSRGGSRTAPTEITDKKNRNDSPPSMNPLVIEKILLA